nr:hypothetical protein RSP597_16535 [Ralstonia solanacearum]
MIWIIKGFFRGVLKLDLLLVWLDDSKSEAVSESVAARVDVVTYDDNIDATRNIGDKFECSPLVKGNIDSHIISSDHIGRVDHLEQPLWIAAFVPINLRADAQRFIHIKQLSLTRQVVPRPWIVLDVAMVIEAIHDLLRQPRHVVQRLLADRVTKADRCGGPVGGRETAAGQRQQRGRRSGQQHAAHDGTAMPRKKMMLAFQRYLLEVF